MHCRYRSGPGMLTHISVAILAQDLQGPRPDRPMMLWPWDAWTPLTPVQAVQALLLTAVVQFITNHSIFRSFLAYIAQARGFSELKPLSYFGYCSWHGSGDPGNVTYVVVFSLMTTVAPNLMAQLLKYYPSLKPQHKSEPGREKKGDIIEILLALLRCDAFLCSLFAKYACFPEGKESLQASVKLLLHLLEDACALSWHCLEFWCERQSQTWNDAAQDQRNINACVTSWHRDSAWMVPDVKLETKRAATWARIMGGPQGQTVLGWRPQEWNSAWKRTWTLLGMTHLETAQVSLGAALQHLEKQDEEQKDMACWRYMGLDIDQHDSQDRLVYITPEDVQRMQEFIERECSRHGQWLQLVLNFDDWSYEPATLR